MLKVRILILVMFAALTSQGATNWFALNINSSGQIAPSGTNLFGTNLVAGTNILFIRGTNGEITINVGIAASGTNFQDLYVTNRFRGTNYDYTLGTNSASSIMSWEWFTNLMTIFTNGLTSTAYVNTIVNTTNLYVLIQNGTANLMLSTNGTNMGGTFKMLTGGTTPPLQVLTSNLTTALIVNTNGNFGINTNAPQFNEHINGTIGAHGLSTNGTVVSYIGRLNTDELVETAVVTGGGTSSGQWLGNLATATGITLGIYKYASLVSQAGVSAGTTNTSLLVYPASNFTITGLGISTTTVTLGTGTNITAAIQTNGVDAFTVVLTGNASRTHALVSAKSISVTTNDYVNIRWTADGNVASQAYNGSVSYTIP